MKIEKSLSINYDIAVKKYHLDRVREALKDEPEMLLEILNFVNKNNSDYARFKSELYSLALSLSPNNKKLLSFEDVK